MAAANSDSGILPTVPPGVHTRLRSWSGASMIRQHRFRAFIRGHFAYARTLTALAYLTQAVPAYAGDVHITTDTPFGQATSTMHEDTGIVNSNPFGESSGPQAVNDNPCGRAFRYASGDDRGKCVGEIDEAP